ncbi:unnamed protein product [Darwinula stevensoni]|uniref:DUF7789 domain-containing protein n=1 Tax=Darwinula stevensoni TaxID=69355 RepID=A0A7R8XC40_9CRUS|nr:unnamed protein product [Darwinula stevensoni]CAG0892159.1 unnamed protein product [Darwinula stevensoni]
MGLYPVLPHDAFLGTKAIRSRSVSVAASEELLGRSPRLPSTRYEETCCGRSRPRRSCCSPLRDSMGSTEASPVRSDAGKARWSSSFGVGRPCDRVAKGEWVYLVLALGGAVFTLALTVVRFATLERSSDDYTFGIVTFVNAVFCVFFVVDGVRKDGRYNAATGDTDSCPTVTDGGTLRSSETVSQQGGNDDDDDYETTTGRVPDHLLLLAATIRPPPRVFLRFMVGRLTQGLLSSDPETIGLMGRESTSGPDVAQEVKVGKEAKVS